MPTFVEEIQSIADGDASELEARVSDRIGAIADAIGVLEEWTEASRETRTELASKYEAAKTLARDEVREATTDEVAAELPVDDLLSHPAVTDQTKRRLGEYSTKLFAFLDEERSYEGARERLLREVSAELERYERLLAEIEADAVSVRDAQQEVARFARTETIGSATQTAVDVLLESGVDGDSEVE